MLPRPRNLPGLGRGCGLNLELHTTCRAIQAVFSEPCHETCLVTLDNLAVTTTVIPPIKRKLLYVSIGIVYEVSSYRLPLGMFKRVRRATRDSNGGGISIVITPALPFGVCHIGGPTGGASLNGSIQFIGVLTIIREMPRFLLEGVTTLLAFILHVPTADLTGTAHRSLGRTGALLDGGYRVVIGATSTVMVGGVAVLLVAALCTRAYFTVGGSVDAVLLVCVILVLPFTEGVISLNLFGAGFAASLTGKGLDTHGGAVGGLRVYFAAVPYVARCSDTVRFLVTARGTDAGFRAVGITGSGFCGRP